MNTTSSNQISTRAGLALLLIACSIVLPTMALLRFGSALFGEHPLLKVFLISATGGALSGVLLGGKRWLVSGLAGMLAGIGAVGAIPLYVETFQKQRLLNVEFFCLLGFGSLPGVLLGRVLTRTKDETAENEGTEPI